MRTARFSIAGLMGAVLVAALGFAALRSASSTSAGVTLLWICGVLCLSIVGVVCRKGAERASWLGFALFGWGYLALAFWSSGNFKELPTATLLQAINSRMNATPQQTAGPRGGGSLDWSFFQVAHCLWALLAAILGGVLARAFFTDPAHHSEQPVAITHQRGPSPWRWWRRPAAIGVAGLVLVASAAFAGSRSAPGLWAGITFLLTCGLLGLATLGAIFGQGRRREIWLGATLFGIGYMVLTFGRSTDNPEWPYPSTSHLLNAFRTGFPPHVSGFPDTSERFVARNARILKVLEQPIPLRFPNETPLEDILKYIRNATLAADGKATIPIYVDPVGLRSVGESMESRVSIDIEGTALKNSLRICLKKLGLVYSVRDGFLMISEEGVALPVYEDPFLVVGHCLLALIAAGFGGVMAPLVSGTPRQASVEETSVPARPVEEEH
ncbi:MAG: hypothetical protein ACHRXM_13325 [Isosphaerales bacterium]